MNNLNQNNTKSAGNKAAAQRNQSLARALLESEKNAGSSPAPKIEEAGKQKLNPFAQALTQAGGKLSDQSGLEQSLSKQAEMLAQQKKERLRQKLHDRINPVETHEVFSAQAEKNIEELQATREELKTAKCVLLVDDCDLSRMLGVQLLNKKSQNVFNSDNG